MEFQQLLSKTRKCIDEFNLIDDGDKIAVALSGGKDSISLSLALKALQRFYPKKFTISAFCIDMGFDNVDFSNLLDFFNKNEIEIFIEKTDISKIIFDIRQESNPCSLCSKLRKGILYPLVKSKGFNKVALGHNKDDLIETLLMSLIYEGRINTFKAKSYLDRTDITIIRPLLYIDEIDIKSFVKNQKIPVLKSPCPVDGKTKREYIKNLIFNLDYENKGAKKSMFNACIDLIKL